SRKPVLDRQFVTLTRSLLLIAGDPISAFTPDRRHLEQAGHKLAGITSERRLAVVTDVGRYMLLIMEVAAHLAKLRLLQSAFCAADWKDTALQPVFPPFMVEDVSRAEFTDTKEAWAVHDVEFFFHWQQGSKWKARKVVARQEGLCRKISIGVEVRLRGFVTLIQQQSDFAFGLLFL